MHTLHIHYIHIYHIYMYTYTPYAHMHARACTQWEKAKTNQTIFVLPDILHVIFILNELCPVTINWKVT